MLHELRDKNRNAAIKLDNYETRMKSGARGGAVSWGTAL
jgi:hypothetical protein